MKTSERFDRAIAALVKGYMNNTLAKGNCSACAVGNIVAHSLEGSTKSTVTTLSNGECAIDYEMISSCGDEITPHWQNVFSTQNPDRRYSRERRQEISIWKYDGIAKKQIDVTGYSWKELSDVEWAFEKNTKIHFEYYKHDKIENVDKDQLAGLFAVVDILCKIEGYDDVVAQENKALFVKCESV
jgi:hypothetical protein